MNENSIRELLRGHPYYTIHDLYREFKAEQDSTKQNEINSILEQESIQLDDVSTDELKRKYVEKYKGLRLKSEVGRSFGYDSNHSTHLLNRLKIPNDWFATMEGRRLEELLGYLENQTEYITREQACKDLMISNRLLTRMIKEYGLELYFKNLREQKLIKDLVTSSPNKYTRVQIADKLGLEVYTVASVLQTLKLKDKIINEKAEYQMSDRVKRVVDYIESNPNKYTRKELVEILGEKQTYINTVICRYGLGDLVLKERYNKGLVYGEKRLYVEKFVRDNPNKYTIQELSKLTGVSINYILALVEKSGLESLIVRTKKRANNT